jgi:hypothetical protein
MYLPKGNIGDFVWEDLNKDGKQDAGEAGVSGIRVILYNAAGDSITEEITNATGNYTFEKVVPGDYYIVFTDLPTDFGFSPQDATGDATDSDADQTGQTAVFTLQANEDKGDVDAGLIGPSGELGNKVWDDINEDGIQDPNEPGIPGVVVTLYKANGDSVSQQVTGPNGDYLFINLAPGGYYLEFGSLPGGYGFTTPDVGGDDELDSDADPVTGRTGVIILNAGQANYAPDAGLRANRMRVCEASDFDVNQFGLLFTSGTSPGTDNRYTFDANGGQFIAYANGTARLTGRMVNKQNSNLIFEVDARFIGRKNWTDWSALGRQAKGAQLGPYQTWEFYEVDSLRSKLIGQGGLAGDTLRLRHMPVTRTFGPQVGDGANDRNNKYGMSGWWFFTSTSGNYAGTGDFNISLDNCMSNLHLNPVALLEGAFDQSSGLMRNDLQAAGKVPLTEPYTGLGYTFDGGGNETTTTQVLNGQGPDAIVDWVLLELRSGQDSTVIVASRAALLKVTGQIVEVDGVSPVVFDSVATGFYYVAIHHRNHLGVMTGIPMNMKASTVLGVDFSSINLFGGTSFMNLGNGRKALFSGDASFDGQVQNTDDVYYWTPQVGQGGYLSGDYNLNGQVQNSDKVIYWIKNAGKGTSVPR